MRVLRRENAASQTYRDRPPAAICNGRFFTNGRQIFTQGEPNGRSVGIVGSAGGVVLCYLFLALGYDVTVYERMAKAGGLDTYGMAEYKMPQAVSLDEAEHVAAMGVKFMLNTEIVAAAEPETEVLGGEANRVGFDLLGGMARRYLFGHRSR